MMDDAAAGRETRPHSHNTCALHAHCHASQSTEFQRLKAERDKIAAEMEAARGERRLATVTAARTAAPVPARAVTATSPLVGLDWLCDDLPQ